MIICLCLQINSETTNLGEGRSLINKSLSKNKDTLLAKVAMNMSEGQTKNEEQIIGYKFIISKRTQIVQGDIEVPADKELLDKILSVYYQTLKKKKKTGSPK